MLPKANYKIERTRRKKTVGLSIGPNRTVRVLAPKHLPRSEIDAIIYKKRDWIERALQRQAEQEVHLQKSFQAGECLSYLGRKYELHLSVSRKKPPSVRRGRKYLHVQTPSQDADSVRSILEDWYAAEARRIIPERVAYFEKRLGVKHRDIKIKKLKSRWGSCNVHGRLVFNWLILQAPLSIVDLLVVHELCHLREMNHSPAFWRLVASVLPDYKERRKWLRQNGPLLNFS